jgi:hypothetical protein
MQHNKITMIAAFTGIIGLLGSLSVAAVQTASGKDAAKEGQTNTSWEAKGTLFEACSCSVPCPCNFGQPPTRGYCHTIYAYRLKTARFEGVTLDGLVFGGGEGPQGAIGFVDARATPAQRPVLEKLAIAVFGKGGASGGPRKFVPARIGVTDSPNQFNLEFGESGGFAADVLIGADGKNPIIVENNTTWPVRRFIKGKTTRFDYKDALGNRLHFDGVNANLGEFNLASGQAGGKPAGTGSCCAPKTASRAKGSRQ